MIALWAFILTVIYWAGITGSVIQTGWVWMSITLPFMIWRGRPLSWPLQALGLCAAAYAIAALWLAPTPTFAIYNLWMQFCIGLAFILGAKLESLDAILRGFACGIAFNVLIVLVQWFGYQPVDQFAPNNPAGLFFNPSVTAFAFAIGILWALAAREWLWLLPFGLGLAITGKRTGFVVLGACAFVWALRRDWRLIFIPLAAIPLGLLYLSHPSGDDSLRLQLWAAILHHLSWLGHGPGILDYIAVRLHGQMFRPEYAHNEYLDFIIQYGIGAVFVLSLAAIPLFAADSRWWYLYFAFAFVGLFSYQLHSAPMAALGAILAGHLSRDWNLDGALRFGRRSRICLGASPS